MKIEARTTILKDADICSPFNLFIYFMDGPIPEHILFDNVQVEAAHLLEDPQDVGHLRRGAKVHKLHWKKKFNFPHMV